MNTRSNPYVGPRAFNSGEAFYGRDSETRALFNRLISERIVLMVSPSGAGKSSLINAGLRPLLEEEQFHVFPVARVGAPPGEGGGLKRFNRYVLGARVCLESSRDTPPDQLLPLIASTTFAQHIEALANPAQSRVLIFDQFEEILTVDPVDRDEKHRFFRELGEVLARDSNLWALFSMREEYIAALQGYADPLPTRLGIRFRLEPLDRKAATDAIRRPAADQGVTITEPAVNRLLKDLCKTRVLTFTGVEEREGDHIEPVQLQVVCVRLWENLRDGALTIDDANIEALGGVNDALEKFFAERVAAAAKVGSTGEVLVRKWIEQHLVTPEGIRAPVLQGARTSKSLDNRVLDDLVDAHILRRELRHGSGWYELAHDRLIEPIRRNNADWFARHQSLLQRQAALWHDSRRPAELLISGKTLVECEQWAQQHLGELTDIDLEFLHECRVDRDLQASRADVLGSDLAEAGWAVIFCADADPRVAEALHPLLEHRSARAGSKRRARYRSFAGPDGYRPGETMVRFLRRHGVSLGHGAASPDEMPRYILLVGSPEEIPFLFQYQLTLHHAVGRLTFDTPEEYAVYARSVIASEVDDPPVARRATFFGPTQDAVTFASAQHFVEPVATRLAQARPEWAIDRVLGQSATRARLQDLLRAATPLTVLFFAGHCATFPAGHARQEDHTGALLCQDWPGRGPIATDHFLAAADLRGDERVKGAIVFLWSSFSAGSPRTDDFPHRSPLRVSLDDSPEPEVKTLAPRPFVTHLPKRLLAHPGGGALAVVGHVDRHWFTRGNHNDTRTWGALLERVLQGETIGAAMQRISAQYAELSFMAHAEEESGSDEAAVRSLQTSAINARNYIILGDPAVRLKLEP